MLRSKLHSLRKTITDRMVLAAVVIFLLVCICIYLLAPASSFAHLRNYSMLVGAFVVPLFIFLLISLCAEILVGHKIAERAKNKPLRVMIHVSFPLLLILILLLGYSGLGGKSVLKKTTHDGAYLELSEYFAARDLPIDTTGYTTMLEPLSWEVFSSGASLSCSIRVTCQNCAIPQMTQKYIQQIESDYLDCEKTDLSLTSGVSHAALWKWIDEEGCGYYAILFEYEEGLIVAQLYGDSSETGQIASELVAVLSSIVN